MTTASIQDKRDGQRFWDANPCGGEWASYAQFAEWYAETEPYAFEVLGAHQWEGKKVLEVGCGQGVVLNHLARKRARAYGIDMSAVSIARTRAGARELGCDVHVSLSDAENLPFPPESFDAVVSFGVLHHTPDTARSVAEVWRVLKPGGTAIVMLYRTGNPKWWATRAIRALSRHIDRARQRQAHVASKMRAERRRDDAKGTALLELFGVPTMQAFSNEEARRMFAAYSSVGIVNYSPGFKRLADVAPRLKPLAGFFSWIDRTTQSSWGFYQVIRAVR